MTNTKKALPTNITYYAHINGWTCHTNLRRMNYFIVGKNFTAQVDYIKDRYGYEADINISSGYSYSGVLDSQADIIEWLDNIISTHKEEA